MSISARPGDPEADGAFRLSRARKISDSFKSLPDKKEWAEYYRVIDKPMCFDTITVESLYSLVSRAELTFSASTSQTKVTKRAYTTVQQFIDDVTLIFDNAQKFNEEYSRIWQDAEIMRVRYSSPASDPRPADFALAHSKTSTA